MTFGSQTVTFVTVAQGAEGRFEREKDRTRVDVEGCLFISLPGQETVTETDVIIEWRECTAPPVPAAVNADATGEMEYGGKTYQITSVEPNPDFSGGFHNVTVTGMREIS